MPRERKWCGDCPFNGTVLCEHKPPDCPIKPQWEAQKEHKKGEKMTKKELRYCPICHRQADEELQDWLREQGETYSPHEFWCNVCWRKITSLKGLAIAKDRALNLRDVWLNDE